jgi:hypothetical protein
MDASTIVRVENLGDTIFHDAHNGKPTTIQPGESCHVELGACRTWLGVNDEGPTERANAVQKIMLRWGYTPLSTGTWEDHRPKIEVYEENQPSTEEHRIWFPADDPEGHHATYPVISPAIGADAARQQARIDALEEKLEMLTSGQIQIPDAPTNLSDLPADDSGKTRRTPVKAS